MEVILFLWRNQIDGFYSLKVIRVGAFQLVSAFTGTIIIEKKGITNKNAEKMTVRSCFFLILNHLIPVFM